MTLFCFKCTICLINFVLILNVNILSVLFCFQGKMKVCRTWTIYTVFDINPVSIFTFSLFTKSIVRYILSYFFYQIRCHGSILILPESGNEHLSTFQQFNKKQAGYITVYWKFPDKLISYFALTSVWFRVTFAIDMPK